MNWIFDLSPGRVRADFDGDPTRLTLCQIGVSISELNRHLERSGRALATSGASNGQTIPGAIATGTYSSAIGYGAIQGHVVGLQLLVVTDRSLWVERASRPVVSDSFIGMLGIDEHVKDDSLFEAALVHLGACGLVNATLVEARDSFLLEARRRNVPFDDQFRVAVEALDFPAVGVANLDSDPYFALVVINPYDTREVSLTFMHERAMPADHTPDYTISDRTGIGYDMLSKAAALTELIAPSAKLLVGLLFDQELPEFDRTELVS